VLRALGAGVTLVARGDRLLRGFDHEIGDALAASMRERGIELSFARPILKVEREADGYALHLADGAVERGFDELIWATGRDPNTRGFGLDVAGVALDARGFIATDEYQNTNAANVYAVGDVTGRIALTPVAVAASRRLADRVFGGKPESKLDYANVPTTVFAHPPIGTVGLSEEAAHAQYGDTVRVHRSRFRPMLTALAGGEERTLMKLVCVGDDERVVGIHSLASPPTKSCKASPSR
jgi:glutathione reductase (NADPH)